MNDRPRYYLLRGRETVPTTLMEWARDVEHNRRIAVDHVAGVRVSTIFLGLDHSFGDGPPLLFETIVFGPDNNDLEMLRYSTLDEAESQHKLLVQKYSEQWRTQPETVFKRFVLNSYYWARRWVNYWRWMYNKRKRR